MTQDLLGSSEILVSFRPTLIEIAAQYEAEEKKDL